MNYPKRCIKYLVRYKTIIIDPKIFFLSLIKPLKIIIIGFRWALAKGFGHHEQNIKMRSPVAWPLQATTSRTQPPRIDIWGGRLREVRLYYNHRSVARLLRMYILVVQNGAKKNTSCSILRNESSPKSTPRTWITEYGTSPNSGLITYSLNVIVLKFLFLIPTRVFFMSIHCAGI